MNKNIFYPLGMPDTGFHVPSSKVDRFTANYYNSPSDKLKLVDDPESSRYLKKPGFFSGGGGLVSTFDDYIKFSSMLLNKGVFQDKKVINASTVELMTKNHLFNNQDLLSTAMPGLRWAESSFEGIG